MSARKPYSVGVDLGGTKIGALVFDIAGKIVGRGRKKTKAYEGVEAGIGRIERTIREALDAAHVDLDDVASVGIGAPGQLDLQKGMIVVSPNLGWNNVPLVRELQSALSCKVCLLNDVDAGVYGEYVAGAARGARCVVGVFPGTGIGAGCVYNGELITGGVRSCMEIGHLPLAPHGGLCGCGRRGCLETVASRLAIAGAAAAAAYRGDAPHLMAQVGCDLREIRAGVLASAIKEGDKVIEEIVRDAARWLGRGVAVAVNLLAPDIVVLGGGLVEAMPELYLKETSAAAKANVLPAYEGTYKMVVAVLGDDAVASGAAAWALREDAKA